MNSHFNRRNFIKTISTGTIGLAMASCNLFNQKPKKNVLFILIDDLGWADLNCTGSTFYETPNIDKLATQSTQFTNAYVASPVCSPTRASLLTGKHPARLNITDWIPGDDPKNQPLLGPKDLNELPLQNITLAESFKEAGYATGFFGKWHLGGKGFYPQDQGFDINVGGHEAGHPASYFYPYKNKYKHWDVPNLENGKEGEYLTDRLTNEAIKFIQQNQNKPFFCYLSYYTVHAPIQSKPKLKNYYDQKKNNLKHNNQTIFKKEGDATTRIIQENSSYAGMVTCLDNNIGKLSETLAKLNLDKNTIIVFMSDNGGLSTLPNNWKAPTANTPLRAGKGWLYEGGIRVPMFIKQPGSKNKITSCNTPVLSTDFYPTLLDMCGIKLKPEQHKDGKSLVPLLTGTSDINREFLCWHYPHYHGSGHKPSWAIRQNSYKLIEWFEDGKQELYNLQNDIGEKNNLITTEPEIAKKLKSNLEKWGKQINAQMPKQNPNYKK